MLQYEEKEVFFWLSSFLNNNMTKFRPFIFEPKPSFLSQNRAAKIVSSRMDDDGKYERRHKNYGIYQDRDKPDVF